MKKIINGKVYDTATAQKIAEWEINLPTDINYLCESLYLKKTGEYFIFGSGGANTRYASVSGSGNFRPGELIVPITLDNAKKWAEEHLDGNTYEAIFGDVVEDDGSITLTTIRLPSALVETVRRRAIENGVTMTAYIQAAIEKAI